MSDSAKPELAAALSPEDLACGQDQLLKDPVVLWDAMFDAGTSLIGSYVWLRRRAETPEEAAQWTELIHDVKRTRAGLSPQDQAAQREALQSFVAAEAALQDRLNS